MQKIFNALVDKGEIVGSFSDDNWMAYSGLNHDEYP